MIEYNKDKNYAILRLEDFKIHPMHEYVLSGFFMTMGKMMGVENADCSAEKSPFKGDECYEFILKW
jgi:hypothetical protein